MKSPVRVAVTGAAGQIAYSLIFRVAHGDMLGPDQPVILQLARHLAAGRRGHLRRACHWSAAGGRAECFGGTSPLSVRAAEPLVDGTGSGGGVQRGPRGRDRNLALSLWLEPETSNLRITGAIIGIDRVRLA